VCLAHCYKLLQLELTLKFRQTVALLRENSVKYGFFNILADDDVRQGLKEYSDWPTFPQLYVNGELVGGLDIVSFPDLNVAIGTVILTIIDRSKRKWQTTRNFSRHSVYQKAQRTPPFLPSEMICEEKQNLHITI
jgi:hypothetical protein